MAEAVGVCADVPLGLSSPAELVETLDAVVAAERMLTGVKLRLIRHIDAARVVKDAGASSMAAWLRGRYRYRLGVARGLVEAATGVATGPDRLREAVAAGELDLEQIVAITATMAKIPAGDRPEVASLVEREAGVVRVLGIGVRDIDETAVDGDADRVAAVRRHDVGDPK